MCGIAGFISLTDARDSDWLESTGRKMAGALAHRGPDDEGVFVSPDRRVMFASTRLAVRDLSQAGHQPMVSPDGRVVLAFNGELYRDRGTTASSWPRRGDSDTEEFLQIVHGAPDAGGALRVVDAMFAAAWYDAASGTVRLARDHFGVKPLVYALVDGGVLFASEPDALFASGLVTPAFDRETFVRKAYVRMDAADDQTWYRDVHSLQPAHLLVIDNGGIRLERFWEPAMRDEPVEPESVREAFLDAVRIRLPADVQQAAFVSGGLDSSATFGALCSLGADVRPYVAYYEGAGVTQNVDVPFALEATRHWKREAVLCDVRLDHLAELIDIVVPRVGRPVLHGAELAMYRNYQQVAEHGSVVVYSGHGADEMWGYQDGAYFPIVAPDFRPDMHSDYYLRNLLYRDERPEWHKLLDRIAEQLDVTADDVTAMVWENTLSAYREPATRDPHKRGRYHLMRRFLVYVNEMVDALSAAFSLEDRPIFQDVTLADLAFGMPEYVKNRDGITDVKPFLKQALESFVPKSVLLRPKKGFPAPDDAAFRRQLLTLLQDGGLPFDLTPETARLSELGIGELMFLHSSRRWLALNKLSG
jgi:asparagine synthase (glutamine-hydrolysing)